MQQAETVTLLCFTSVRLLSVYRDAKAQHQSCMLHQTSMSEVELQDLHGPVCMDPWVSQVLSDESRKRQDLFMAPAKTSCEQSHT